MVQNRELFIQSTLSRVRNQFLARVRFWSGPVLLAAAAGLPHDEDLLTVTPRPADRAPIQAVATPTLLLSSALIGCFGSEECC